MNERSPDQRRAAGLGGGIAIGMGNLGAGIAIGVAIALAIGAAIGSREQGDA